MKKQDEELLEHLISMIDETPVEERVKRTQEVIHQIKFQRQETMNNPSHGNVLALVIWYDTLLAQLTEDKAA